PRRRHARVRVLPRLFPRHGGVGRPRRAARARAREPVSNAVSVTLVGDELEAQRVCELLRAEGIDAFFKRTNCSAVTSLGSLGGGPFEIWVPEADAERALGLLG